MTSETSDPVPLGQLSQWHRAALATALAHLGDDAPRVLIQLHGGAACAALARRISSQDAPARALVLAQLIESLAAPCPQNMSAIHPQWLADDVERIDSGTTPYTVARETRTPGPRGAFARWIARAAFADRVPMPEGPAPRHLSSASDLARVPEPALRDALDGFGAEQLALASRGGDGHAVARLGGLHVAEPYMLARLAARALAPHVRAAGGDTARQIAQRLAVDRGAAVQRELQGPFALAGLDTVPPLADLERFIG